MNTREESSGSFRPWGFFMFRQLVRDGRDANRLSRVVLLPTVVVLACMAGGPLWGASDPSETMKRRQQGILTGMPFMANVAPRTFVDDLGRKIYLAKVPKRIVSLAPSITEMLFAIGAGE